MSRENYYQWMESLRSKTVCLAELQSKFPTEIRLTSGLSHRDGTSRIHWKDLWFVIWMHSMNMPGCGNWKGGFPTTTRMTFSIGCIATT